MTQPSNQNVQHLVQRLMHITASLPAMGGAEAGIIGTTHPATATTTQLKHTAIRFAEEYRANPSSDTTRKLAQDIEGMLSVLASMSVITEPELHELIDVLHACISDSAA
jgi:hypothetical protein